MQNTILKYLRKCSKCDNIVKRETPYHFVCVTCKTKGVRITGWRWIRKKVKERDKYTCQMCGRKNFLHIHHKDGNRLNNKLINLITYCRSCHLSQHGKNFEKPISIKVQKYGTRLKYKSSSKSNVSILNKTRAFPKSFYGSK